MPKSPHWDVYFRCFPTPQTTSEPTDEQLNLMLRQSLTRRCHGCGRKFFHGTDNKCNKCYTQEGGEYRDA